MASLSPPRYLERLTLPWWLALPVVAVAALLAAEIHLGANGVRSWLPYLVLIPLAVVGVWWLSRIRITVDNESFRIDDAVLPLRYIDTVVPLDADGKREILGPSAHPLAFVIQRPWISGAVQIMLNDPDDPTPYWVISTRHPTTLATAL